MRSAAALSGGLCSVCVGCCGVPNSLTLFNASNRDGRGMIEEMLPRGRRVERLDLLDSGSSRCFMSPKESSIRDGRGVNGPSKRESKELSIVSSGADICPS